MRSSQIKKWLLALVIFALPALSIEAQGDALWPDINTPPPEVGGGEKDVVVIVAIEEYYKLSSIPGARANADAWHQWFEKTRQVPLDRIILLRDDEASKEGIEEAAKRAVQMASKEGRVWFIFIGHGAPSKDQKNGVLVGADAQQTAQSIYQRSVSQDTLVELLEGGPQSENLLVIDACFSGQTGNGALVEGLQPIIPVKTVGPKKSTVLAAGQSNEFAGPLPGERRPAFSYLVLGALRGWGDSNSDGEVTDAEALEYARYSLRATLRGRNQTPQFVGAEQRQPLASRVGEAGPDLGEIARKMTPTNNSLLRGSAVEVPTIKVVAAGGLAAMRESIEAVELYDHAETVQKSSRSLESDKAQAWCQLASFDGAKNPYRDSASQACKEWTAYAEKMAEQRETMAGDFDVMVRFLKLKNPKTEEKVSMIKDFRRVYGEIKGPRAKRQIKWLASAQEAIEDGDLLPPLSEGMTEDAALEQSIPKPEPRWGYFFLGVEGRVGGSMMPIDTENNLFGFGSSAQILLGVETADGLLLGGCYGFDYASSLGTVAVSRLDPDTGTSSNVDADQNLNLLLHSVGAYVGAALEGDISSYALVWASYVFLGDAAFDTGDAKTDFEISGPKIGIEWLFAFPFDAVRLVAGPAVEIFFFETSSGSQLKTEQDINVIFSLTFGAQFSL